MPIIASYSFRGSDYSLLGTAFPGVFVAPGPLYPMFLVDKRVIVFHEDEHCQIYPDKEVILITPYSDTQLDTREGFLRFLAKSGVKATNFQIDTLLDMPDGEFWQHAKLACSLKGFPKIPRQDQPIKSGSKFVDLYRSLFRSFDETYVHYNNLVRTYPSKYILIRVARMMGQARDVDRLSSLNPAYRSLLQENRKHAALFACQLAEFIDGLPIELTVRQPSEVQKGVYPDRWGVLELFYRCSAPQRTCSGALNRLDVLGTFGRYVIEPTTLDLSDLKNRPVFRVVLEVFGYPNIGPIFRSMGLPWH